MAFSYNAHEKKKLIPSKSQVYTFYPNLYGFLSMLEYLVSPHTTEV